MVLDLRTRVVSQEFLFLCLHYGLMLSGITGWGSVAYCCIEALVIPQGFWGFWSSLCFVGSVRVHSSFAFSFGSCLSFFSLNYILVQDRFLFVSLLLVGSFTVYIIALESFSFLLVLIDFVIWVFRLWFGLFFLVSAVFLMSYSVRVYWLHYFLF